MDLASAVQFLLAYEASLKLEPGQKPPPPSAFILNQLCEAVAVIDQELTSKKSEVQFSELPPSVWDDWPLCCGVDLGPRELSAARSLSPLLHRGLGLLSLFLALHSCAEGGIDCAGSIAPVILLLVTLLNAVQAKSYDPAPFPSAHLAARVGHRLINADGTLDFRADEYGDNSTEMLNNCFVFPYNILARAGAVPHEAAGLGLAKEMAAVLDALSAAERGSKEGVATNGRGQSNRLPFVIGCHLLVVLDVALNGVPETTASTRFRSDVYREAASLPAYDPVLLLQSFARMRSTNSRIRSDFWSNGRGSEILARCRFLFWLPLSYPGPFSKIRPADAYTAMRLGLEDVMHLMPGDDTWLTQFFSFACRALHSGLVQPELILRARPQLLEGLVKCLARDGGTGSWSNNASEAMLLVAVLGRSPAVSFHLRKFFSRSGCLKVVLETLSLLDMRRELVRLLGPRAAQADVPGSVGEMLMVPGYVAKATIAFTDTAKDLEPWPPVRICDLMIRGLTLDMLREPRHAQPILQFLSELAEAIAVSKRPHGSTRYVVLMVVGLGKACLAFSKIVARGLNDIREAGPKRKGLQVVKGAASSRADSSQQSQQGWRARLVEMGRELSFLRRRVLHELLPLAEAREAALWEGVREEEVVAALQA